MKWSRRRKEMRFVQIGTPHASNETSFRRGCARFNIEYEKVADASQIQGVPDLIWAPMRWIPNTWGCKMIMGPHFFVFPSASELGASENSVYNCLSEWNKAVHESFLPPPIPYVCFPFGVEVPRPSEKPRTKVVLYYKHRAPEDLAFVEALLTRRGKAYTVIHYGHYRSEDYAALLDESQFMVVVDAHESQGFALGEAMARNVPLLVYDITSMKQEYVGRFHYESDKPLAASSVPYWDARCGERTTDPRELDAALTRLEASLPRYRPREFIQEILSDEACFQRLIQFVQLQS